MAITFDDLPAAPSKLSFDDLPDSSHGLKFDDLPDTVNPQAAMDATAGAWNAATGPGSLVQANAVMDQMRTDEEATRQLRENPPMITPTPTFLGEAKQAITDPTVKGTYQHLRKAGSIAYDAVREPFSGLLGPTEKERIAEAVPVTDKDGNVTYEYKPMGDRLAREAGLMTSFLPMKPLAAEPGDSTTTAAMKAAFNTAQGIVGSVLSPVGVMTPTLGAIPGVTRAAGGAFAADMASHIPGQLEQAFTGKTAQERIEGGMGAAVSTLFGFLGGREAVRTRVPEMTTEQVKAYTQSQLEKMAPKSEAPIPTEKQFIPAETLDGLHVARERLREGFEKAEPKDQVQRQELIDSIDDQLLRAEKEDVQMSAERVSQRGQSQPQESPAVVEPTSTETPSTTSGRSRYFEQAQREAVPEGVVRPEEVAPVAERAAEPAREVAASSAIDPEVLKTYQDTASRIADQVAAGQPDIIKEAARDAAMKNAEGSLASGKNPTIKFMRASAKEAAGKAAERQPVSIDAGEAPIADTLAAKTAVDNSDAVAVMNQSIDASLTPRDAGILRDAQVMQIDEVATKNGISRQRVHQILKESYGKIQAEMQRRGVTRDDVEFTERERTSASAKQTSIPEELRTDPEVASILSGEMNPTNRGMGRQDFSEGGALFGKGAGKKAVNPVGSTPRGDSNFIRVDSAPSRFFRGLLTDGAADVMAKSKNVVGKALAKAIRRHVDIEQEIHGQLVSELSSKTKGMTAKATKTAIAELEPYLAAKENGRPLPALSSNAKAILDAWQSIAEKTGQMSLAHKVQVFDPATGGYRDMKLIGKDYVPRMFDQKVQRALADPDSNVRLFNKLADELAAHRGISPDEAAAELNGVSSRFRSSDYLGNIEMARSTQLPEIFYDYNIGNLISRYVPAFSERMAQIISYGQRLGPREAPLRENLWDVAMKESRDSKTQDWLREAEDASINLRAKSGFLKTAQQAQTIASGTLLSSPTTSVVRNALSGLAATGEVLGVKRATQNLVKAAIDAQAKMDAKEIGAIRENIGDFLHADQLADSPLDTAIRGTTNTLLKYSLYNGSENFVRTHAALTASQFAKDGVKAIAKNPNSGMAKEALAMFKRIGVDAEKVVAENADWKTGPETRKFVRTIIRDTQGGYRFDQVPLWANSPVGRFVYQFGRYGTQRARNIWNNGIKPAIGEDFQWNGKTMTRRDLKPLIKMGMSSVLLGEAFAGISSLFFGRDRKDASLKEIAEAFSEDQKQGIALAGERLINDVIMSGTLGIWGQPVDFVKSLKDQSRFKNPAEPPGLASGKALATLAQNALDQNGRLTKKDLLSFTSQLVPGVKQLYDLGRNVFDESLFEAENDVKTLRNAGARWATENKIDAPKRSTGGDLRKSPNAPEYEPIYEALMTGDADTASVLAEAFANKQKNRTKAMQNLKLSVKSRQPFRVGPFTNGEYKREFMEWAEKKLPAADFEQVKRVQERYEESARRAGLW